MRRVAVPVAAALLLAAAPAGDPVAQGIGLYRAGHWREAAAAFARADGALAQYDRGDALAWAGDYAAALDAFDAALADDPQDADARANRAVLAGLLAARAADAPAAGRSGAAGVRAARRDLPPPPIPASSFGGEGFVGTRQSRSAALSLGAAGVAPPRAPSPEPGAGRGAAAHGSAAAGSGRIGRGGDLAAETPASVGRAGHDSATARERQQATEQWIATIHDDPARFLRLRFELEHQRRLAAGTAPPPADDPW